MAEQMQLECVSCDTSFDPSPHGGFCPDCDTPHPDYEQAAPSDDVDDSAAQDETDAPDEAEDEPAAEDVDDAPIVEADAAVEDVDDAPEEDDFPIRDVEGEEESEDAAQDDTDWESREDGAEVLEEDDEAEADESEVDTSPAVCPECGSVLDEEAADDRDTAEPGAISSCPDCGNAITDESFCPNCGTDLDAIRDEVVPADDAEAPEEAPAVDVESITLLVDDEPYSFGDGDTFGRQDEAWLEDLVNAAGGPDDVAYVSGDHIEFSIEEDGVYVRDISRNGTSHNGNELDGDKVQVEDGDTLVLAGRVEVEVSL